MTGSKVLIVKLPELHADVKALEAFRAYVCDALGAGTLVLPLGTTYAVEEFPALGAVEVVEGNVPESGKTSKPPLPDIPAAKGVSRPEPKPVEPPERPPEEKADVPKPTEIKLPLAVGQATPRFAGMQRNDGKFDIEHWRAVNAGLDKLRYGGMKWQENG